MVAKALVVVSVLAVGGVSLAADQTPVNPEATAKLGALRPQKPKGSYATLFAPQRPMPAAPVDANTAPSCKAAVIEAERYFDRKATQPNDGTKYTMRALPAPACR